MLDTVRLKLSEVRAKIGEYERLSARLAELEQTLNEDAAQLKRLKGEISRQVQQAIGQGAPASQKRTAGGAPARPNLLPTMLQDQIRVTVEKATKELVALQGRLDQLLRHKAAAQPNFDSIPFTQESPASEPAHVAAHASASHAEPAATLVSSAALAHAAPAHVEPPPVEHAYNVADPAAAEPEASETAMPEPIDESPSAAESVASETPKADHAPSEATAEKAVEEAVETGRRALAELDQCLDLSRDLAGKGLWHAAASVVSSKSPDHAAFAQAVRAGRLAKADLDRFRREVDDIRRRFGDEVDIDEIAAVADPVLGSLVKKGGGHDVQVMLSAGRKAYHEIRAACARLQLEGNRLRARRARS